MIVATLVTTIGEVDVEVTATTSMVTVVEAAAAGITTAATTAIMTVAAVEVVEAIVTTMIAEDVTTTDATKLSEHLHSRPQVICMVLQPQKKAMIGYVSLLFVYTG